MTSAQDRMEIVALIDKAVASGARQFKACAELGLHARTFQRWTSPDGEVREDRRPTAARPAPTNRLTQEERDVIVDTCNGPEFASLPPSQIVPILADRGEYIGSESSLYRVLRERGQAQRRGRAKAPHRPKPPASFEAKGPCEVWSWDITWLPGPALGVFFYLYMIVDIFSRKIVGWEIHESESSASAAKLLERAIWAEGCIIKPVVLHSDNGSPMKGATMKVTMSRLGVTASFSRPRVSNDNPFSEALFRTCKYVPGYPADGFATLEEARIWVQDFVAWYNTEHRHSAIRFVTPDQRHRGQDAQILAARRRVYQDAKAQNPNRWSGAPRNWDAVGSVWLNPDRSDDKHQGQAADDLTPNNAGGGGLGEPTENRAA